jgi:copper(I)-binding protein
VRHRASPAAFAALAAVAALALVLTGCASKGPELKVSGAYIPQPALADMAAGYFTVTNTGGADATLTSVTSGFAADITMHTTKNSSMHEVGSFTVPAGGKLVLGLGGNHLMLMNLKHKPLAGEKVPLQLHFRGADAINVQVPVEPAGYRPGN